MIKQILLVFLISFAACEAPQRNLANPVQIVDFVLEIISGIANGAGINQYVPDFAACNPFGQNTVNFINNIESIIKNWQGGKAVLNEIYQILEAVTAIFGQVVIKVESCPKVVSEFEAYFNAIKAYVTAPGYTSTLPYQLIGAAGAIAGDIPAFETDVQTFNGSDLGNRIGAFIKAAVFPNLQVPASS